MVEAFSLALGQCAHGISWIVRRCSQVAFDLAFDGAIELGLELRVDAVNHALANWAEHEHLRNAHYLHGPDGQAGFADALKHGAALVANERAIF